MKPFGESPWESIPLSEPVHVEAGKNYAAWVDTDGTPHVEEVPSGGLFFSKPGTVHGIFVYVPLASAEAAVPAAQDDPNMGDVHY